MSWLELYEVARSHRDAAAGYYNDNVRVETATGAVNVRIPIHGADIMDLKIWAEDEVLTGIAPYVDRAPRLLHRSVDPPYQIHEFIDGAVLNDIAPRGTALPRHVLADVVRLFRQLVDVPAEKLPATPVGWPGGSDTIGFAHRLSDLTTGVYAAFRAEYAPLFAELRIPAAPLEPILARWERLRPRPLGCVHSDVHRKNVIVNNGTSTFLDWELALHGDPVYDLAVHVHKMDYRADERDEVIRCWLREMPPEHTAGWEPDLAIYLAHEQVKSAIVDTVRSAQLFTRAPEPRGVLVEKLTTKLTNAHRHWATADPATVAMADVERALTRWAQRGLAQVDRQNGWPAGSAKTRQ